MKAERDELTLRIFPALRKVCEERGIAWGEVDLRWGIPEEKSKKGETLGICLDYIEKCRPYFIGMLGERYGWIDPHAAESVKDDYPWVHEQADKSITELEILHGVLNNPDMATHAFFYFRDKAHLESKAFKDAVREEDRAGFIETDAESIRKLTALKERIRSSGFPFHENYQDPVHLGELVKEDLMRIIDTLEPPQAPLTEEEHARVALDREDSVHEAFAASRFGVYIPRQDYYDLLDHHASGTSPPLIVLGDSGSGKSALLSHWAYRYRTKHPYDLVLVHFVGASSESTDWASMLRRFMGEFKRKFSLTDEIPEKEEALMTAFRNWLPMAAAHGRVVLVIDALNQLEDRNGAPDLVWLPQKIPENIRLILSTLPGRPLDAVRKREWPTMTVQPLTVLERNTLIKCYLQKYRRELDAPAREELAKAKQTENPLFLRALLEELRIHGQFGKIPDQIREYLVAQTVDALYEMILARYEQDYERDRPNLVEDTLSLIWAARRGLSKVELMDLLGTDRKPLPDAYWAPLYLAMEHSLVEKDGRITFFHNYLQAAVEHRYLPCKELKRAAHLRIANYFAIQSDGPRRTEELPWQLSEANEWDRLVTLLNDPPFFLASWQAGEYDVKRYWVRVEANSSFRIIEVYRPVIQAPQKVTSRIIWVLRTFLYQTGHVDEASDLGEYLIQSSREDRDLTNLEASLNNQALILQDRGDLDGAMALLLESERMSIGRENFFGLAKCLCNQANIHSRKGYFESAIHLLKNAERIFRELGNDDGLATSLGNQALILKDRGEPDKAMTLLEEVERICRELGNDDGLATSLGNQALILKDRGELNNAMTLLKEQERICRELGIVTQLMNCLINQALILTKLGELDRAMILYMETEKTFKELKNLDGLQVSLGGQALVLRDLGELDQSMTLLKEAEEICRELKNNNGLQRILGHEALILKDRGDLEGAFSLYKEKERICRETDVIQSLIFALMNQAKILSQQKKQQEALSAAEEAYELASVNGYFVLANQIYRDLDRIRVGK